MSPAKTGDRRQEAGDRRQSDSETSEPSEDRRQERGGWRQEIVRQ